MNTTTNPVQSVRLGKGKKVHALIDGSGVACSGTSALQTVEPADGAEVTCALCIKRMAAIQAEAPADNEGEATIVRTPGTVEDVTLVGEVDAPADSDEAPESDDIDHEEVARQMTEQIEQERNGVSIRVPKGMLGVMDTHRIEGNEERDALFARLTGETVRNDGSVRLLLDADEMETLAGFAQDILGDDDSPGALKNEARAKIKWLARIAVA